MSKQPRGVMSGCHTGSDREHLIGRVCSTCGHPATCYTLKGIGTELCDIHSPCPCDGCSTDREWAVSVRLMNANECADIDAEYWLRGIPELLTVEIRARRELCPHGVKRGNVHACYLCNSIESDGQA